MLKAFKYKLNPTDSQKVFLNKHFGCARFVFNYYLNQRINEYQINNNSINYNDNAKDLTIIKSSSELNWLCEVNSQSLQDSLKNLDKAYKNFFKHKSGFPKFKSKHITNSFCVPQNVKVCNEGLNIPKFKEPIKMIVDRKFKGEIRQCTISKTSEGILIHADVNGSINILRKYVKSKSGGDLSLTDVSGVINHPVRINPTKPIGL